MSCPCFLTGDIMNKKMYNAIIVGGGASGLVCAISAKQKNPTLKIAIIEKNDRVGKKLLSTGNGRCNLTHKNIISENYVGSFCKKLNGILSTYTTDYILDFFGNIGLATFADKEGRYYPLCKQATAVLDVLRLSCERLGIEIFCSQTIKSIKKQSTFSVMTTETEFCSDKLVLCCGSKAAPKLGGNASASDYLKNFGHTFIPFSPALCPVNVKSDVLKSLKGIRAEGKATLVDEKSNTVKTEIGEIQFGEKALSGICVFNLSLYTKKGYRIILDLLRDYSDKEILKLLEKQRMLFSELSVDNIFSGIFQKRVGQAILKMSGIKDFSRNCKSLSDKELLCISKTVKNMSFEVISNDSFDHAQCTLGGVVGKEINENTMESKKIEGLYICGEAIDICGECGGYNLHFAFASGHIAGENIC